MKNYDLAVVGGGASGMMAAIAASKNNLHVILIERNPALGRKILATGNGRCNVTNRFTRAENYYGASREFIEKVLHSFDQFKVIKFFEELGVLLKEEDLGRMFPRTNQAQSIVSALEHELKSYGVDIKFNSLVRSIEKNKNWEIRLESGEKIESNKLILACGGRAAHHLGSSGDGYFWAEKFGHSTVPTYPSLVPIETEEAWPQDIQGLKIEALVSAFVNDKKVNEKQGDVLFTHFGLSGPAIMAQAGSIAPHIGKEKIKISLDLFPDKNITDLDAVLQKICNLSGAKQIKNVLAGLIPSNLASMVLVNNKINPEKKAAEISKTDRNNITFTLKNITLTVKALRPFKEAQVTRGGILTDEIDNKTLESKKVPGLFFAGEILDVNGDSGGFNLQWAWSSGHLAGMVGNVN